MYTGTLTHIKFPPRNFEAFPYNTEIAMINYELDALRRVPRIMRLFKTALAHSVFGVYICYAYHLKA